jgi:hypothetical protein
MGMFVILFLVQCYKVMSLSTRHYFRRWTSYFIANVRRFSGAGLVEGSVAHSDAQETNFRGWIEEIRASDYADDDDDNDDNDDENGRDDDRSEIEADCSDDFDTGLVAEDRQGVRVNMSSEEMAFLMRWLQSSRRMATRFEELEKQNQHNQQQQQQQQQQQISFLSARHGVLGESTVDARFKADVADVSILHFPLNSSNTL